MDVAVLCSGGLDSAVLTAQQARVRTVLPVYVHAGLAWEGEEARRLERLLRHPVFANAVAPLARLTLEVADLYPADHWALLGSPPGYDTPDRAVYLPGRNLLLLAKVAVLCALRGIGTIAMGPLAGNPFPDATPAFFGALARALSLGLDHALTIETPLATLHKPEVVALGAELGVPFELTMSCMQPWEGRHCGRCSKCRERRDGFEEAGVADPTDYATPSPRVLPG